MSDSFLPATPRVAAGALIRDPLGRILLVRQRRSGTWDLPGGYVEPGESPKAAVVREIAEELGVFIRVGDVLVVDWAPRDGEGDKILFVFAADEVQDGFLDTTVLQADEILEAAFVAEPLLAEHLDERLLRRVLAAAAQASAVYLEHGERTT